MRSYDLRQTRTIVFFTGTSNDSWTGGSIVSLLNTDKLVQINACFMDLQPQVHTQAVFDLRSLWKS